MPCQPRCGRRPAPLAAGLALTVLATASCGSGPPGPPVPTVVLRSETPSTYLLRLDELPLPGFTAAQPAHDVDAATLGGDDAGAAQRLRDAGLLAASRVDYFREVPSLDTDTGPVEVIATVLRFGDVTGADQGFAVLSARADAAPGAEPVSTGPLGAGGHATLIMATAPDGVVAVQVLLVWHRANLVNQVVIRERLAGSPVEDALHTVAPMVAREGT